MKLNLRVVGIAGTVSLVLDKAFAPGEVEKVTAFVSALANGVNMTNPDAANGTRYRVVFEPANIQNKINAIKVVRQHLGCGLKEAKDFVEATVPMPLLTADQYENLQTELHKCSIYGFSVRSA